MYQCFICMYVCAPLCAWCQQRPERISGPMEVELQAIYMPREYKKPNLNALQEKCMPFLQPLIILWNHVFFCPSCSPPSNLLPTAKTSWMQFMTFLSSVLFYCHCCSGFLRFSSRHPRELGNLKFLPLLCVVANSGFEKPNLWSCHCSNLQNLAVLC